MRNEVELEDESPVLVVIWTGVGERNVVLRANDVGGIVDDDDERMFANVGIDVLAGCGDEEVSVYPQHSGVVNGMHWRQNEWQIDAGSGADGPAGGGAVWPCLLKRFLASSDNLRGHL
eukprot:s181_g13.t1